MGSHEQKPIRPEGSPLFWHSTGRWCKKVQGKSHYFGSGSHAEALAAYRVFARPERPEGSPLFWHATGRWCKKVLGKLHYFGRGSHDEALAEYLRQKDDLHAGKEPKHAGEGEALTVYFLCAKFLTVKKHLLENGELSARTFGDYAGVCKLLISRLGKHRPVSDLGPEDFITLRQYMARSWGPVRLGSMINQIRVVFNFGFKNGLLPRPPVYGEGFNRPSKKVLRQHRQSQGLKLFTASEIKDMLAAAGQPLKSMVLLGINCGFGNADVGELPLNALDLACGWLTFPRPKTAIERRIPLWPETIAALRDWLSLRPQPVKPEHTHLVFLTQKRKDSWNKTTSDNPISNEFAKLMKTLALAGHRGFYCLRHTFQTVGDECGDFLAVRKIMGHASDDIAEVYRERVSDERLGKVTEFVRSWLFSSLVK